MIKPALENINRILYRYNNSSSPSLLQFWHKWNYEHTLIKNVLTFTNRALKQINKYHIFRWDWMAGLCGALVGIVVVQLEEVYYQAKIGYKPIISDVVINAVLKNKAVSSKLSEALDGNVFKSNDVQYMFHQVLINQVIDPQKDTIKNLILESLKSLNSKQSIDNFGTILSENIGVLNKPIGNAAFDFLNSETMDKITAKGLRSVLESLSIKEIIADEINNSVKKSLKETKNSESLYLLIKERLSL